MLQTKGEGEYMKPTFHYRTDQARIDKLKALALLLNIDVNEILDYYIDHGINHVYQLLTKGMVPEDENNNN